MLDLTKLQSPRFEYTVIPETAGQPNVIVSVDLDRVALDLMLMVPTLLKPTGDTFTQEAADAILKDNPAAKVSAGDPIIGLQKWLAWFTPASTATDWPKELPNPQHVESAVRRAFAVPKWCGWETCKAILFGWLVEYGAYLELKKNTPNSPVSPEASPA